MKRILPILISAIVIISYPLNVYAGAKVMPDGGVFDPDFYYSTISNDLSYIDNEDDLYSAYKKSSNPYGYKSAAFQLAQYADESYFMDNVSFWDGYGYSVSQWKYALKATFFSLGGGSISPDSVAKAFMKDEYKTKELLSDVINSICDTEEKSYDEKKEAKSLANLVKIFKLSEKTKIYHNILKNSELTKKEVLNNPVLEEIVSGIGEDLIYDKNYKGMNDDLSIISKTIENAYTISEDLAKVMNNYEENIELLDTLELTVSDGTLKSAIRNLKESYRNAYVNAMTDMFSSALKQYMEVAKYKNGADYNIGNISYSDLLGLALDDNDKLITLGQLITKTIAGKGFSTGTAIVDLVLSMTGETEKASKIDKVIISGYLRADAIKALRTAENNYLKNPGDRDAYVQFYNTFLVTQGLTYVQYKNMYEYYNSAGKSDLANRINEKISAINNFTPIGYLDSLSKELDQNMNTVWGDQESSISIGDSNDISDLLGQTMGKVKLAVPGGSTYSEMLSSDWMSRSPYTYELELIPSNDDMPYYVKDGIVFASVDNMVSYISLDDYNAYSLYGLKPFYSPEKVKSIMSSNGWTFDGVDHLNYEGLPPADNYLFSKDGRVIEYEYVYEDEEFVYEDNGKSVEYDFDSKNNLHIITSSIYYYYDWVFNEWE